MSTNPPLSCRVPYLLLQDLTFSHFCAASHSQKSSYPLAFVGCRDGLLEALKVPKEERTDANVDKLTYLILGTVTMVALKITDLSFIMSFGGATLGNALIYVYPAMMFRRAVKNMGMKAASAQKMEVHLAMTFAAFGIGMGCMGAKMALGKL